MPKQAALWEWKAELDTLRDLSTGGTMIGHRVRYREQGARRWRSFLLTTDDGSSPTESMVLQAIEAHADVHGGDHSASRRAEVLEREAPHLLAPSSPTEASSHDA
jgi:hypothetical protein